MQKRITFRHTETTPVLEEFANKHLERIEKALANERTPITINLVLEAFPDHAHHKVELHVVTPHFNLMAHHEGPEMYQEIDRVIDIMLKEIRKAQDKFKDDQRHQDSYKSA